MISILGRLAILLALAAFSVGGVMGIAAAMKRSTTAWRWSNRMAYLAFFATTVAMVLMEYALISDDFSVSYVAKVGSTQTPLWVTIVSLWSSLEGSILLWAFVLAAYIAAFAFFNRNKHPDHTPWALGISQLIGVFFAFLVAGVANPFSPTEAPIPLDGPGPNPLLQNHVLMIIHPPALYLGYVGMTVPFGMGAAALFAGKIGAAWSRAIRYWLLIPWGFLTIGIMLGGWWSYEVLGWGGYWAWDPVENASFLPWLTATAFLHSALLMERKGKLKGWGICLLMSTFLLTLLGTFMTRSGVFNSVHSFTKSDIGPSFLIFLAFCTLFSLALISARVDTLEADPSERKPGLVSRDSAFLLNNLLFAAFTFTVLIGTVYPLIYEALKDKKLSVGEPYFNALSLPICIGIVFLMGVGPALPWGRSTAEKAFKRLAIPLVSGVLAALLWGALTGLWVNLSTLSLFVCGFALATTLREMFSPALARMRSKGESAPMALLTVFKRTRRRMGGYVVHIGVIVAAVAITGSSSLKTQDEFVLRPGETAEFEGFVVQFDGIEKLREDHRISDMATISVLSDGNPLGRLQPRMNHYTNGMTIGTPAVQTTMTRDLYLTLRNLDEKGPVIVLQVIIEPLILWLWLGGGIMGLGTMISAWPSRKKSKSTAEKAV